MKMRKMLLFIASIALNVNMLQAQEKKGVGMFVEPIFIYERGETEVNYSAPFHTAQGTLNGLGIGARVGVHVMDSLFLGLDGRYSRAKFKDDYMDVKAMSANWGPVIGLQMPTPIGIRLWAGYIVGGEMDPESSNGLDLKFKSASGYRVGGGIRLGIPSLNLEYQSIKYSKTENESSGIHSIPSYNNTELKNNSYVLSVSFPLALL